MLCALCAILQPYFSRNVGSQPYFSRIFTYRDNSAKPNISRHLTPAIRNFEKNGFGSIRDPDQNGRSTAFEDARNQALDQVKTKL